MESFYDDFQERHGLRPTAIETFHAGFNPHINADRSWLRFVERKKGLSASEATVLRSARSFFDSLEITPMVRSYKALLLLSMFDGDSPDPSISIEKLVERVAALVRRMHKLEGDFSVDLGSKAALGNLLIKQPIQAFVNGEGMGDISYFTFDKDMFGFRFDIGDPVAFGALLREILDWRLGQYLSRGRKEDSDRIVGEPLTEKSPNAGLKLWERYLREVIPPAFGLEFNIAIWNVGFVVREPNIFVLVSLEKTGLNPDHQYVDHFISDREFSWQSQNRTKQSSRHGRIIHDHVALGVHVHLLVRPLRRGPFIYCGEVEYISWEGDAPITVRWQLRNPVPKTLWSTLLIPQ